MKEKNDEEDCQHHKVGYRVTCPIEANGVLPPMPKMTLGHSAPAVIPVDIDLPPKTIHHVNTLSGPTVTFASPGPPSSPPPRVKLSRRDVLRPTK